MRAEDNRDPLPVRSVFGPVPKTCRRDEPTRSALQVPALAVATESPTNPGITIADAIANRLIFKSMEPPCLLELPGVAGASRGPACSPMTPQRANLVFPLGIRH